LGLKHALACGHQIETVFFARKTPMFRVTKIQGDQVTLDGNHPLAGQDLIFELKRLKQEMPRSEELAESEEDSVHSYLH